MAHTHAAVSWRLLLSALSALSALSVLTAACSPGLSAPEGAGTQVPGEPAALAAAIGQAPTPADAAPPPTPLRPEEQATVDLFERTRPSVVYITTLAQRADWFRGTVSEVPQGTGTGFVWDDEGHIITNFHVLADASSVEVVLDDQSTYDAEWVGGSASHDLAVLRIDAPREALHPVLMGNSNALLVGQNVYAIGNPFGLSATLTTGVVSALGRRINALDGTPIEDVIQSDAAINRGNSGGPLLDSAGRVIGVNTQIASPSGASAGVGFAVPISTVRRVVPELIFAGEYTPPRLGIRAVDEGVGRRIGVEGVLIAAVEPGSGAADAGLRPVEAARNRIVSLGDVIQSIDGEPIRTLGDLRAVLDRYQPGDEVAISILRDGETEDEVTVRLQ